MVEGRKWLNLFSVAFKKKESQFDIKYIFPSLTHLHTLTHTHAHMLTQTQTHTNTCSYTHVVIKQYAEAVSVRQAVITALKALEKI